MNPRRHTILIGLLACFLLAGGTMPCGLPVPMADVACEAEAEEQSGARDEAPAEAPGPGCCTGCLACCARFVPSSPPGFAAAAPSTTLPFPRFTFAPFGDRLPIWRPPRV